MTPKGLSLLQAPPFGVVAVFFLSGTLFGVLGSVISVLLYLKDSLVLPVVVHIFTLGFATNIMLGALFQMLPVVAGAVIENPKPKAYASNILLNVGALTFLIAFYTNVKVLYAVAIFFLLASLIPVSLLMLYKLLKVKSFTPTSAGMKYSLISFLLALVSGTFYLLSSKEVLGMPVKAEAFELHVNLMLLGWVGVLISSVAFQVIEMFFITPPYPKLLSWFLPPLILLLSLLTGLIDYFPELLLGILFTAFAMFTIYNLLKRRRRVPDPVVYLWITGMVFLVLSMVGYIAYASDKTSLITFLVLYGNFALSIITAMLYRIVPFLVWFHLSNEGVLEAPTMHEVIALKRIWWNFYIHIGAVLFSLFSIMNILSPLFALSFYTLSFLMLFANVLNGVLKYYKLTPKT